MTLLCMRQENRLKIYIMIFSMTWSVRQVIWLEILEKNALCFEIAMVWQNQNYVYFYLLIYILFHHHYHQICFIWLNREILFQAVIIFHWVLEEVCFVSTNPWPLKLQVGITLFRFNFSDKPNCTSSRFFFNFNSRKSFNFIVFVDTRQNSTSQDLNDKNRFWILETIQFGLSPNLNLRGVV